jgi:polar amino acid transport system substrate-binding protein
LTAAAFIYLHKNHAGLVPGVAAALRSMKQDGSYEEMYRRMILPYGGLVAR